MRRPTGIPTYQHVPTNPWSFTGVTTLISLSLQSKDSGYCCPTPVVLKCFPFFNPKLGMAFSFGIRIFSRNSLFVMSPNWLSSAFHVSPAALISAMLATFSFQTFFLLSFSSKLEYIFEYFDDHELKALSSGSPLS